MAKKGLIYITFLLVLFPLAYAANETLYSGKVYSGENVNIDNETYFFALSTANDKISVDFPSGTGVIVRDAECEIKDYIEVCFNGVELWYQNYSLDKMFYKAKVNIYNIVSTLEFTRTVEDDELLIGEETKVDVTIKNGDDRAASDIVYSDIIPKSFAITEVSGCVVNSLNDTYNAVNWYGNLDKNLGRKCFYKLKALENATFKSKASLQYNDGVKLKTVSSDTSTITVQPYQLKIITKLAKEKIEPGEQVDFNITLKNINTEETIRVTLFRLLLPLGVNTKIPPKFLKQDYKTYTWKGTIGKNESIVFTLKLNGNFIGKHTLKPEAAFIIKGVRKEIEGSAVLDVYAPSLIIDYRIDKDILKPSEKADIEVIVGNPSDKHSFNDIELVVESEMFDKFVKKLDRLNPLDSKLTEISFTAPDVEGEYPISISVNYESEYDQILRLKEEQTVKVGGESPEEVEVVEKPETEKMPETAEEPEAVEEEEKKEAVVLETEEPKGFSNLILIIISISTVVVVLLIVGIITVKGKIKENKEKERFLNGFKEERMR